MVKFSKSLGDSVIDTDIWEQLQNKMDGLRRISGLLRFGLEVPKHIK